MEEMEDLTTVSDGEEVLEELNGGRAPQRARKKWKFACLEQFIVHCCLIKQHDPICIVRFR